VDANEEKILLP